MAVELKRLYDDIYPLYEVRLLTESCFQKHIGWVHMIENAEFITLLHGDELIFNSSLNDVTPVQQRNFIDSLITHNAGGLIMALQSPSRLCNDLISYCNERKFPLFITSWETSFLNIMRRFSEILLTNERNETNLVAALKNAIYYPDNEALYVKQFERNGYYQDLHYVISIISYTSEKENSLLLSMIRHNLKPCIVYEESSRIIILTTGFSPTHIQSELNQMSKKVLGIRIGVGSLVSNLSELYLSYEHAFIASQLSETFIASNPLLYDDLGVCQILCDLRNPERVATNFVKQVLGKLYDYDHENHTSYLQVLKDFFDNDCSIVQTANATFFHQNTLKYKIKHIKEILGYDITTNENRTRIMLCFYILKLSDINHTHT